MRAALILLVFPAIAADGWIDLGSLAAWRGMNGGPVPPAWSVEDGSIKASGRGSRPIVTREEFRDFELSWEWKLPANGNSGVKYLVEEGRADPDMIDAIRRYRKSGLICFAGALLGTVLLRWRVRRWWAWLPLVLLVPAAIDLYRSFTGFREQAIGFEYQMIDISFPGRPNQKTGGLYDLIEPAGAVVRPSGEWNESRVVVRGSRIEHWLNGVKTVDADIESADLKARVAGSKFRIVEGFASKRGGKIALTHHSSDVWFRNLRVRRNSWNPTI